MIELRLPKKTKGWKSGENRAKGRPKSSWLQGIGNRWETIGIPGDYGSGFTWCFKT